MKSTLDRRVTIRTIAAVAVFCAFAYVLQFFFRINVPPIPLVYDLKDAVMAIGAILFGPFWGIVMSLISAILEITISGQNLYGLLMDFISSSTFVCIVSIIYRRKRTMKGALIALGAAALGMTGVMMIFNLLVTPLYFGFPISAVLPMLPTLILPFNLTKGILNAELVLILYKPVSTALKRAKLVQGDVGTIHFSKKSAILLACAIVVIVICVLVFFFLMNGTFAWGLELDKAA